MVDQKCEFYRVELWCHRRNARIKSPWLYTTKKAFDQQQRKRNSYSVMSSSFCSRCWKYDFQVGDWVEFKDENTCM
jgi:hypothetical protein